MYDKIRYLIRSYIEESLHSGLDYNEIDRLKYENKPDELTDMIIDHMVDIGVINKEYMSRLRSVLLNPITKSIQPDESELRQYYVTIQHGTYTNDDKRYPFIKGTSERAYYYVLYGDGIDDDDAENGVLLNNTEVIEFIEKLRKKRINISKNFVSPGFWKIGPTHKHREVVEIWNNMK